ncbi:MAG: gamma carbonic anhydrase family protein [Burkholderiaceae bacterium]|nr:gamma carbonic anhydrase family protein [Burkholderiaceae bacterium]
MPIYRLGAHAPNIHPDAWIAESADLIGSVELARDASVWFHVTIRGDNEPIRIGIGSNVQESCVLHTDPGHPLEIGEAVTIGHQAMLHGCTIGDGSLVGIQAIVLNGARIGAECLIGAGALVAEGKEIPPRSVVLGSPGRIVRTLTDEQAATLRDAAARYVARAKLFKASLTRVR